MDVLVPLFVKVVLVVAMVVIMVVVVRQVVFTNASTSHLLCLSWPILKRGGLSGEAGKEGYGSDAKEQGE